MEEQRRWEAMASMDNEIDDAVNGDGGKRAKKQALAKDGRRRLLKEKRNMSTTVLSAGQSPD